MTADRSFKRDVRNPVLALPAVGRLRELPPEARGALCGLLGDVSRDARHRAEVSWRRNKAPMAAYWRAVSACANHIRRAIRHPPVRKADQL